MTKGCCPAKNCHRQSNALLEGSFMVGQKFTVQVCSTSTSNPEIDLVVWNGFETTLYEATTDYVFVFAYVIIIHCSQFGERH